MSADVRVSGKQRETLSKALYAIHRKGSFYTGLSEAGEDHLNRGGAITPTGRGKDMSFAEGMKSYSCCTACHHSGARDNWPCDTVRLLLESGILLDFDALGLVADEIARLKTTSADSFVANTRPDGTQSVHRW